MSLPHIYLTELESNERLTFPMPPESIESSFGTKFISYDIMSVGDVQIPRGESLQTISWSGTFPGSSRRKQPYILEYHSPKELQSQILEWKKGGKKLRLLVTETPINIDVYIDSFHITCQTMGDYQYDISFCEAREIVIATEPKITIGTAASSTNRPTPPPKKTYTVKKDDNLWQIAQKEMGNGNRYPELYEANKGMLDARNKPYNAKKYTIYVGQVLTIPE